MPIHSHAKWFETWRSHKTKYKLFVELLNCWVEPSWSPHGSPILLVDEKGQDVAYGDWVMKAQSTRGENNGTHYMGFDFEVHLVFL